MECELKRIKIYYEIYGEGHPILMIHGFMPDHRLMKGCMEPIFKDRPNYKRIYFDLPGMGKTKSKQWIKNSDQIFELVLEFIDKIIPNQSFIIASESYGCYLARGLIYKRMKFIDGVLFLCPLIIPQPSKRSLPEPITLKEDRKLLSKLSSQDREEFKGTAVVQNQRIWERFKEEVLNGIRIADDEFLNEIFEKGYAFSFDVDKLILRFDKPTLFLLGRQDISVGYRDAWNTIEQYPRATFAILDEAGHILEIEKEILFNYLVNEWLDRVEYYISSEIQQNKDRK
ncbi:MAG: alpha/beta fold hydrolase [Promethearchaeota archaeon]